MKLSNLFLTTLLFLLNAAIVRAADNIEFNFQGRIFSGGQPINGTAQVKFALIDTSGTTSVWSNDETSVAAGEPLAAIPVSVDSGVFDVMIGDTSIGMEPIHGAIFNGRDDLRMRIWLSDGVNGFEQLTPDRRIPNADLLGLRTLTEPLTVYVDATNGSDLNSGLNASYAKETIGAAVRMMPKNLQANARIQIANGIYRESVELNGFTVANFKRLTLVGDETCSPTLGQVPAVRITGTDSDSTPVASRANGISVVLSNNIAIDGILIDYFSAENVLVRNSSLIFLYNSQSSHASLSGIRVASQADVTAYDSLFSQNGQLGGSIFGSYFAVGRCHFNDNGSEGVRADNGGRFYVGAGASQFNNNAFAGIQIAVSSLIDIGAGLATCNNNTNYGVYAQANCFVRNRANISASGNGIANFSFDASSDYN